MQWRLFPVWRIKVGRKLIRYDQNSYISVTPRPAMSGKVRIRSGVASSGDASRSKIPDAGAGKARHSRHATEIDIHRASRFNPSRRGSFITKRLRHSFLGGPRHFEECRTGLGNGPAPGHTFRRLCARLARLVGRATYTNLNQNEQNYASRLPKQYRKVATHYYKISNFKII